MTVTMGIINKPILGKAELAKSRLQRVSKIISPHWDEVMLSNVIAGEGAGDIHLYASAKDFESYTNALDALNVDPEMQSFNSERNADPASVIVGPNIFRTISGKADLSKKVSLQRVYTMTRENVNEALKMMPELTDIAKAQNVNVFVTMPIVAADNTKMGIIYQSDNLQTWGKATDHTIASKEFQAIVLKGSQLGTLTHSRLLHAI